MNIRNLTILSLSLGLLLLYSCNCEDVYNALPDEICRYYDIHDTIVFYNSEVDSILEFVVCERIDEYDGFEKRDHCSWVEYDQYKGYHLFNDSCNSDWEIYFSFEKSTYVTPITFINWQHNEGLRQAGNIKDTQEPETVEIHDRVYEDVFSCSPTQSNGYPDRISTVLISLEYGLIQFQLENLIFNFVNNETNETK